MPNQTPIKYKEKPWGREIWFACLAGYAGKILEVKAGKRLSLQYHEQKTETQYLMSGKVKLTVGKDQNSLREIILNSGDKYDIYPYTIHRVEAIEDSQIFEVSTDQLEDVVRLADDFNRPDRGNHEELDKRLSDANAASNQK
ncbi:cupin [Patescibacteria group bacterium]|nr:cupin [Patescibacteria group bacterium]MBU1703546.1 cupin [Patescibacteria group bacterium]MBU1953878.1 cupin [Patescibacteria group bacterium]